MSHPTQQPATPAAPKPRKTIKELLAIAEPSTIVQDTFAELRKESTRGGYDQYRARRYADQSRLLSMIVGSERL